MTKKEAKLWLYCLAKDAEVYISYMKKRGIKYSKRKGHKRGEVCLVMSKKLRPFSWKLNFRRNPATTCPSCGAGNKEGRTDCWKCKFELGGGSKPHFGRSLRRPRRRRKLKR